MSHVRFFFVLLCLSFGVAPVAAQDVQVPLNQDSTVYVVDPELRKSVGLFPEVEGFQGAELYRLEEGGYELVIRYQPNGQTRRERRSLTGKEVKALRTRISRVLAANDGTQSFTQEGRYGLIASTTLHGVIEGALLAGALDAGGSAATTLVSLGGATGFFVPLFATQGTRVTEGEADMTFYGGLQGYAHAVEGVALLSGDDPEGRATAGLAALTGAAEATAGYLTARRHNWSAGHAEMVSFTGMGGNLIGLGVGIGILGEPENPSAGENRLIGGTMLLGSIAGMYLGHQMGRTDRYTEGDARIYLQSAVQGVNLMGSFLSTGEDVDSGARALLLSGSAVGGGVIGRWLVQDRDFSGTHGNLVALGSVAGSLLGLALTAEAESGSTRAVVQALGSATGFGITYGVLEGEARRQAGKNTSSFDLNLNVGTAMARAPQDPPAKEKHSNRVVPRVTVSARF